jgi:hypothetical protein
VHWSSPSSPTFFARDGYAVDIEALELRYREIAWETFADWAAGVTRRGVT